MAIGAEFEGILAAAKVGAEWAFSALYREFNPRLSRYFAAQAPAVGEDLESETWLGAARGLRSFEGGEDAFRAWLFTIARRRLVQHWRDSARNPATATAVPERSAPDDPEAHVLADLSAADAARAIAGSLSRDQAEVVLLRVLGDLDIDEVAEVLGKRPGTVRVLQHRALRKLAETFSVEGVTQ